MQSRWVRWIAYMLLAALVVITSCQAMAVSPPEPVALDIAPAAGAVMAPGAGR